MPKGTCSATGCEAPILAGGWCVVHYSRVRAHGTPDLQPKKLVKTFRSLMLVETDDCILWPHGTNGVGYGCIRYEGKRYNVHALACEVAHGPRPGRCEAAHLCGVRLCMNKRHLRWASRTENERDKILHGTSNRGLHGKSKLTPDDVRAIRAKRAAGMKPRFLAAEYGVGTGTIGRVVRSVDWAWVD